MAVLSTPNWVRWWFRGAAVYGAGALLAACLRPAPAGDALFFYGFVGTALAFQFAFWIIGGDPVRHRPLMLAAVAEKLAFAVPVAAAATAGRAAPTTLAAGAVDLVLGIGFLAAWRATPRN